MDATTQQQLWLIAARIDAALREAKARPLIAPLQAERYAVALREARDALQALRDTSTPDAPAAGPLLAEALRQQVAAIERSGDDPAMRAAMALSLVRQTADRLGGRMTDEDRADIAGVVYGP